MNHVTSQGLTPRMRPLSSRKSATLSILDIGTSTVQSRALAGLANGTLVCCLPGSTGACRTAWEGILVEQLDARHRPCNFVPHLKAVGACESRG